MAIAAYRRHVDDIVFDQGVGCGHSCVWVHVVVGVIISIARGAQYALCLLWVAQTRIQSLHPQEWTSSVLDRSCFYLPIPFPNSLPKNLSGLLQEWDGNRTVHDFVSDGQAYHNSQLESLRFVVIVVDNLFFVIGVVVGHALLYPLSDKFGRQPLALVSAWTMGAMSLLVPWIGNVPLFATLRFFVGASLAGAGSVKLWVTEVTPFQRRTGALVAMDAALFLSVAGFFFIGSVVCNWRAFCLCLALIPFLSVPFSCSTAESFKWLESRDDFGLYPRVLARFVEEDDDPSVAVRTRTFKLSEKDRRTRTYNVEDEDLLLQRSNPQRPKCVSAVPTTTNHMRRLNRAAADKAPLAAFVVASGVAQLTAATAIALLLASSHFPVPDEAVPPASGFSEAAIVRRISLYVLPGLLFLSALLHWILALKGGRIRPFVASAALLGLFLGTTFAVKYCYDLKLIREPTTLHIAKALELLTTFFAALSLQSARMLELESFPVQYRGVISGLIGSLRWISLLGVLFIVHFSIGDELVRLISAVAVGVIVFVSGACHLRFANMARRPLPQDADDFQFAMDAYGRQTARAFRCCPRRDFYDFEETRRMSQKSEEGIVRSCTLKQMTTSSAKLLKHTSFNRL